MDTPTLLGLAAGLFTTLAFIPQVMKIWNTKSAKDVSLRTYVAFSLGVSLWIAYGVLKHEMPIILWNSVTLLLTAAIVAMKLKYR